MMESGESFPDVLTKAQGLPEDLRQIVNAGLTSGRLPHLLEEYLETNRQTRSLWRSFYLSLLYPMLVVCLSLLIVMAFVAMTVPQFKPMFEDFGIEVPTVTMAILKLADLLPFLWIPALMGLVVGIAYFSTRSVLPFAHLRAQLFHALPWVGEAQKMVAASEFCSRLAVLVECRLPLPDALRIAGGTIRDPYMGHLAYKISDRVQGGASLDGMHDDISGMPNAIGNAFRWAHNPETFADRLRSLAIVFRSQARVTASQLTVIAEPVAFVSVALIAGLIVVAMFLPLIKLLNMLS